MCMCRFVFFFILAPAIWNLQSELQLQLCFGVNVKNSFAEKKKQKKSEWGVPALIWLASLGLIFFVFCWFVFSVVRTFSRLGAQRVNWKPRVGKGTGRAGLGQGGACGNSLGSESVASAGKASNQPKRQQTTANKQSTQSTEFVSVLQLPWESIKFSLIFHNFQS